MTLMARLHRQARAVEAEDYEEAGRIEVIQV